MAPALWVLCYSYSYSDTLSGRTNNAAINGLSWDMNTVLPPQAGLVVNGMFYQYTIDKETAAIAQVHIQNKLSFDDSYLIKNTDDWSGLPGNTITKLLNFDAIPKELWGNGEIIVEGEASISNPTVAYNYKYDTCYIVLSDPSCPGYAEALYKWLLDNGLLTGEIDINDPYYDQYVKLLLQQPVEETVDAETEEDEETDDNRLETRLTSGTAVAKIANTTEQQAMLASLQAVVPNFEAYYTSIPGGSYEETVLLEDTKIYDNTRALRNLAQQSLHEDLVQLQYK